MAKRTRTTKTGERIEARVQCTNDAWTVGLFELYTDRQGNTEHVLVRPIATFNTPDSDPEGIARAKAYAAQLEAERQRDLADQAGPFFGHAYNAKGERVRVCVPVDEDHDAVEAENARRIRGGF